MTAPSGYTVKYDIKGEPRKFRNGSQQLQDFILLPSPGGGPAGRESGVKRVAAKVRCCSRTVRNWMSQMEEGRLRRPARQEPPTEGDSQPGTRKGRFDPRHPGPPGIRMLEDRIRRGMLVQHCPQVSQDPLQTDEKRQQTTIPFIRTEAFKLDVADGLYPAPEGCLGAPDH